MFFQINFCSDVCLHLVKQTRLIGAVHSTKVLWNVCPFICLYLNSFDFCIWRGIHYLQEVMESSFWGIFVLPTSRQEGTKNRVVLVIVKFCFLNFELLGNDFKWTFLYVLVSHRKPRIRKIIELWPKMLLTNQIEGFISRYN